MLIFIENYAMQFIHDLFRQVGGFYCCIAGLLLDTRSQGKFSRATIKLILI